MYYAQLGCAQPAGKQQQQQEQEQEQQQLSPAAFNSISPCWWWVLLSFTLPHSLAHSLTALALSLALTRFAHTAALSLQIWRRFRLAAMARGACSLRSAHVNCGQRRRISGECECEYDECECIKRKQQVHVKCISMLIQLKSKSKAKTKSIRLE